MKRFAWSILSILFVCMPALAAPPENLGYFDTPLFHDQDVRLGQVEFHNDRDYFHVVVVGEDGWQFKEVKMFVHHDPTQLPAKKEKIALAQFPYKHEFETPIAVDGWTIELSDLAGFQWGAPWQHQRLQYIVLHAEMVKLDAKGKVVEELDGWAYGDIPVHELAPVEERKWATFVEYKLGHPDKGHLIDSPVGGVSAISNTFYGKTDESGGFDYFHGERVEFSVADILLGNVLADHKVSPLDIFEQSDTTDPRVINMARLLQSLDADADPKQGIMITDEVEACLKGAMDGLGLSSFDFSDDAEIESIIQGTITQCAGTVALASVAAEDAKANLDRSLDSTMFRKNVSRTPELSSSKSKLDIMGVWFPALKANGEPADFLNEGSLTEGIPYYDANGDLIRIADQAKPVVVVYTDGVEETGAEDTWAAISRDDGNTFKRKNLSRAADKTSFELTNGEDYFGEVKKPVFQVKGNNILVAWTSKFCQGGRPGYAIKTCDDPATEEIETPETGCAVYCTGKEEDGTLSCEPDYPYDDPYYKEDIWGVGGPQRSVDYSEQDFPEVGEVPYSCVWTARGTIVTQKMLDSSGGNNFWNNNAYVLGDIVWFKPERLTSGRRDANQIFMGGADGAGFAITWQEDPEGLRPGGADGPGPGWGGATTNHKTDIWYSYITMWDFGKVDTHFVAGGDPQHEDEELIGRPKALVPMALPVRLTDNDVVNTDNLLVELDGSGYPVIDENGDFVPVINPDTSGDGTGSHAYGYKIPGLCDISGDNVTTVEGLGYVSGSRWYDFVNEQDADKRVCVTADGRLLNGDTGASRPNVFLQAYTKPDGSKSAWAIIAYEETKGVGGGAPDHEEGGGPYGDEPLVENGKNAIYHSFDFQNPDLVSAGMILNEPEHDADGNLIYLREVWLDETTNEVVYGDLILDWQEQPQLAYENARRPRFILQGKSAMGASKTVLLILYKEGQEGQGRPSDIMMRRVKASASGNPYAPANVVCNQTAAAENGQTVCWDGAMNMSSVTPTETAESNGEPTSEDPYGAIKVISWEQTVDNFDDFSYTNPYDDARAHRGAIRGDFVVMGYSYTPNWAAARNGNDKYDFLMRRSFDGGVTWTTDPDGEGVTNCYTWKDMETEENADRIEECLFFGPGEFEQARNLSQLKNAKESVIEPRIVAVPGTIKVDGVWTGIAEDKQNPDVFYVSYGTSTNPKKDPETGEQEAPVPADLYYSFSQDRGETTVLVEWEVNPDSNGGNAGETLLRWDFMAKGDPEQGEAQLRMTPNGERFYATWLQEGDEGSDVWFRRIMSPEFSANVATQ